MKLGECRMKYWNVKKNAGLYFQVRGLQRCEKEREGEVEESEVDWNCSTTGILEFALESRRFISDTDYKKGNKTGKQVCPAKWVRHQFVNKAMKMGKPGNTDTLAHLLQRFPF